MQPNDVSEAGGAGPIQGHLAPSSTISVVVPVLNAARTLRACLDSILAAMEAAAVTDLVVVDNGSRDGSDDLVLRQYAGRARFIREPGVHVGQVRNVGAAGATADLLVFIDSDCVIGRDYFIALRRVFSDPSVAASGATYALPDQPGWIEETWDALHAAPPRGPVSWINAGNFAIRRDVFETIGGFDPTLRSGEDTQIGARLRNRGFVLFEAPEVRAVHLGNPKSLEHFFRKHVWHGMGIFGTRGARGLVRRSLALLSAHLLLSAAGVAALFANSLPWLLRLALAALGSLAIPSFSVWYRLRQSRRRCNLAAAVFLYFLYFTARLVAVLDVARQGVRRAARVDASL